MLACEMKGGEESEMREHGVREISEEGRASSGDHFLGYSLENRSHEGDSRMDVLDDNDVPHTDTTGSRESFDLAKWDGKKFLFEVPSTLTAIPSRRQISSHSFTSVSLEAREARNSGPPPREDGKLPSSSMHKSTRHHPLSEQANLDADVENLSFPGPHVAGASSLEAPTHTRRGLFPETPLVTKELNAFGLKASSTSTLNRKESLFGFASKASDPTMTELQAKDEPTRHTLRKCITRPRSTGPEIMLPTDVYDLAGQVSKSTGEGMDSDCPAEALGNLHLADESRENLGSTRRNSTDLRGLGKRKESDPLLSRPISSSAEDIPDIGLSLTIGKPEAPRDSYMSYHDDATINGMEARLGIKPAGQVHGLDWIDLGVGAILKKDIKLEYVYVLCTTDEKRRGCVKVGMTTDIRERVKRVSNCCKLPDLEEARHWEAVPFAKRVEQLVFAELRKFQRPFVCEKVKHKQAKSTKTHHKEWFDVPAEVAIQSVQRWATFVRSEPYDEDGRLMQFWARWANVLPKASEDEIISLQTDMQRHHCLRHERYQTWLDLGIRKAAERRADEIMLLNDTQS